MFFIMGISPGQKKLNFDQLIVCRHCGKYGHMEVFLTYTCLTLFFIPVFRWGKQYVVRMTCCDTCVPIDAELGRQIERGEVTSLPESIIPEGYSYRGGGHRRCMSCGFETDEDYQYCPKCGTRMSDV